MTAEKGTSFIHFRENRDGTQPSREITVAFRNQKLSGVFEMGFAYSTMEDQFNRKLACRIAEGRMNKKRNPFKNKTRRYPLWDVVISDSRFVKSEVTKRLNRFINAGQCPKQFRGLEATFRDGEGAVLECK